MEFKNITLFGTDGECIPVEGIFNSQSPQTMYIQCIEEAEEFGIVLEKIQTDFLGEECEFCLCPDTGEFQVNVLTYN
jgi:hypothetical protein